MRITSGDVLTSELPDAERQRRDSEKYACIGMKCESVSNQTSFTLAPASLERPQGRCCPSHQNAVLKSLSTVAINHATCQLETPYKPGLPVGRHATPSRILGVHDHHTSTNGQAELMNDASKILISGCKAPAYSVAKVVVWMLALRMVRFKN